jgi:hypothetical protein
MILIFDINTNPHTIGKHIPSGPLRFTRNDTSVTFVIARRVAPRQSRRYPFTRFVRTSEERQIKNDNFPSFRLLPLRGTYAGIQKMINAGYGFRNPRFARAGRSGMTITWRKPCLSFPLYPYKVRHTPVGAQDCEERSDAAIQEDTFSGYQKHHPPDIAMPPYGTNTSTMAPKGPFSPSRLISQRAHRSTFLPRSCSLNSRMSGCLVSKEE